MRCSTMLDQITPLIITYNEAANLPRVLDKLSWAKRIIVIDSGSTDETLDIIRTYRQVEVLQRPFTDFASQCNYGLQQVATRWVLSLDADYRLSDELVTELHNLTDKEIIDGYRARFVYCVYGRPLRGTLYPPRTVLYKRDKARYRNEGHGHRLEIAGQIVDLGGKIYHDDQKKLARWISSQQRYASIEASYLLDLPKGKLSKIDKLRMMGWPAPILVLFYTLFFKGCILDGWPGWHYALQRLCAEVLLALEIVDQRLRQIKPS
jgi:glycosyltransferase involved in cell wall biosynthesis